VTVSGSSRHAASITTGKPEFMVHHKWESGGIAVRDNRSTQHCAVADYWPHHRENRRATFDVPGSAASVASVSAQVLKGKKLRA